MDKLTETPKTRVRRGPGRAIFDREMLYRIFDEARVAHIGFTVDEQPYVIPMLCWRVGNRLYIHGSNGSRMINALTEQSGCLTATIVDGMVLAKSAFHHSTNYRSAVVFGRFSAVSDPVEVDESLKQFMESIAPGRWEEVRPPSEKELNATTILSVDIEEASVKVRSGPANEDEKDLGLSVWTGELKLKQEITAMAADKNAPEGMSDPDYSAAWQNY